MIDNATCGVLPPMTPSQQRPTDEEPPPKRSGKSRRAAGRFAVLNKFADEGARLVDTTAQACWWILYRETKPDGLATISHQRIGECVGVSRKTVTRALGRLERAGLVTVVRHGGWRRGPSTYRVRSTPAKRSQSQAPPVSTAQGSGASQSKPHG